MKDYAINKDNVRYLADYKIVAAIKKQEKEEARKEASKFIKSAERKSILCGIFKLIGVKL